MGILRYLESLLLACPLIGALIGALLGRRLSLRSLHVVAGAAAGVSLLFALPLIAAHAMRPDLVATGDPARSADRVASIVYALSAHHDAYGLPPVLIEADARARLDGNELGIIRDGISDRLGPSTLLDLRRHRRPF